MAFSFSYSAFSTSAILVATASSLQKFGVQRSSALHMRQYAIASRVYRSSRSSSRVSFSASLSCLYGFLNLAMAALSSSEFVISSVMSKILSCYGFPNLFGKFTMFWVLFQTILNLPFSIPQESSDKAPD